VRERLAARGLGGDVVDSYRYAARIFSKVVSDGYIGMVRTIPHVYGFIYDRAERSSDAGGFRSWAHHFTARNIRRLIERVRPSVVVCTHAFPCGVMSAYKRLYDDTLPVMGIVTDFAVHPFWIYENVDAYAVATPEIRAAMIARGVGPDRIAVDGIPVDARFGEPLGDRAALRARLGLAPDRPVALVMGGGLGLGPVAATVRALHDTGSPASAVVIVGRNRALARRLEERARRDGADVRILGFVDNVFDWMRASDVLISKPGGLSTSEALAAGVPMILLRPLPGQEQRNARYLAARGAAVRVSRTRELSRTVDAVLREDGISPGLRAAGARIARPDAAERVAARIAALASRARTPRSAGEPAASETGIEYKTA